MKRQKNKQRFYAFILYLLGSSLTHSNASPSTYLNHDSTISTLQTHINFLCSNALNGRLTGSVGEKLATDYVADIFRDLGLEPAGDKGSYFQTFHFNAHLFLGKNNALAMTDSKGITTHFELDRDWRPLSFSDNRSFKNGELIFAGYGIVAPASGKLDAYDAYRNLNVTHKWVVVFTDAPEKILPARRQQISQYQSLRYKAFVAKEHGAKGIIFVNSPYAKHKPSLIPLATDRSLLGSGIIALSVTNKVMANLLREQAHHKLNVIKLSGQTDIKKQIGYGRNVLAKLTLGASTAPMMIIGAHVDHLGHGELGGARDRDQGLHPGADDNASGVASVLEIATRLSALKAEGKLHGHADILFAAWSGEELGLLGSTHFVKQMMPTTNAKSLWPGIECALNLDMVGHLRDSLVVQGVGSSADWPAIIDQVKKNHPMSVLMQNDPYLPTDSTSFYLHGVPTLNFFSGADDNYHTRRDTPDRLNYVGIKTISDFIFDLILTLEAKPYAIHYATIRKTNDSVERTFKVYLGTIPDYTSADVVGVTLSGIAKNSPADQAGLKPHDRIIALAGQGIHDIYDYTFVLNRLEVGKAVKIRVMRGQKSLELVIVACPRST